MRLIKTELAAEPSVKEEFDEVTEWSGPLYIAHVIPLA
ncbi:hypothetical protein OKW41_001720 [Paraburkholderia sp. UCT70]